MAAAKIIRFFATSPVAVITFLLGVACLGSWVKPNSDGLVAQPSEVNEPAGNFGVHLERIDVRGPEGRTLDSAYDAAFVDRSRILTTYSYDGMRISPDGGKTWKRMFVASGGNPEATGGFGIQSLDFLNPSFGWASGSVVITTHDGGASWEKIKIPETLDNIKVSFLNENFGYVAGRDGNCERGSRECNLWLSVYRTENGGRTWTRSLRSRVVNTPWQIMIVSEQVAMITSDGGWLFRTVDSGRTWKPVINEGYGKAKGIARSPDGNFWLFGTNSILKSSDDGLTWQTPVEIGSVLTNHDWWSVDFNRDGTGIAVAEDTSMAITHDGGISWSLTTSNLHDKGKVPVPDDPFDDAFRGIKLHGNKGIVMGSQRSYLLTIPAQLSNITSSDVR